MIVGLLISPFAPRSPSPRAELEFFATEPVFVLKTVTKIRTFSHIMFVFRKKNSIDYAMRKTFSKPNFRHNMRKFPETLHLPYLQKILFKILCAPEHNNSKSDQRPPGCLSKVFVLELASYFDLPNTTIIISDGLYIINYIKKLM